MAGNRVFWLGLIVAALLVFGCSGLLSRIHNKSGLISGTLIEKAETDGRVKRLCVQEIPSWRTWDQNSRKPNGDGIMLQSEMTF
jgi:uncharacterized protein YceK